jgi:hypothetical protein
LIQSFFQPLGQNFQLYLAYQCSNPGAEAMPENSRPRSRTASRPDVLTVQGLRLTNTFRQLEDAHDREQVIALAERLLDLQKTKPN